MAVLRGSNVDPHLKDSPLDLVDVYKGKKLEQIAKIEEELGRWKAFEGTVTGQVVCNLADAKIAQLQNRICMGVEDTRRYFDAQGMVATSEDMKAFKDECRGELRVWLMIKYRRGALESELREIDKMEEKAKKLKGETPAAVKEYE